MGTALPTMPRTAETTEQQLQYVAAHPGVAQRHAFRARLVLAAAATSLRAVAAAHGTTRNTVRKWVRRVAAEGIEGLLDAPRSGRPVLYPDEAVRDLVTLATSQRPGPYALWTHRALREAMWNLNWGVTCSWITTTLNALGLKAHRVHGWIHRRPDPDFEAKVLAVQHAVANAKIGGWPVLSLDEKTAHPVRTPVRADTRAGDGSVRREFEYVRKDTIFWYGIQDCASGAVQMLRARSRMDSAAFIEVLDYLKEVHGPDFILIMDNGPAHTSRVTTAWLAEHPGIEILLTPKHASWVNPIESVFGIVTRQVLKHGWFGTAEDCDQAVQDWIEERNRTHRPVSFTWQPAA
ncbi:IS630 family transposase [Kineococcus arenarius]|uniref:IS630 family transposase n=1 Tax=unclassified Kineococcus TaxID=2621656 RepID=UPI003D7E673E